MSDSQVYRQRVRYGVGVVFSEPDGLLLPGEKINTLKLSDLEALYEARSEAALGSKADPRKLAPAGYRPQH